MDHILACTDFSEAGNRAIAQAFDTRKDSTRVTLLHCVEPPPVPNPLYAFYVPPTAWDGRGREKALAAAREGLEALIPDGQKDVHVNVVLGDSVGEILRVAAKQEVDLVILGTHGRRGLRRLLLGSVTELVIRSATCPVLVVH